MSSVLSTYSQTHSNNQYDRTLSEKIEDCESKIAYQKQISIQATKSLQFCQTDKTDLAHRMEAERWLQISQETRVELIKYCSKLKMKWLKEKQSHGAAGAKSVEGRELLNPVTIKLRSLNSNSDNRTQDSINTVVSPNATLVATSDGYDHITVPAPYTTTLKINQIILKLKREKCVRSKTYALVSFMDYKNPSKLKKTTTQLLELHKPPHNSRKLQLSNYGPLEECFCIALKPGITFKEVRPTFEILAKVWIYEGSELEDTLGGDDKTITPGQKLTDTAKSSNIKSSESSPTIQSRKAWMKSIGKIGKSIKKKLKTDVRERASTSSHCGISGATPPNDTDFRPSVFKYYGSALLKKETFRIPYESREEMCDYARYAFNLENMSVNGLLESEVLRIF